ncbi:MAG: tRNA uracil 4-sulfurtransferase ThiI [Planctomycetota bacterium]
MSTSTGEVVLARFGELWLKGKNRGEFERTLVRNSRAALATLDPDVAIEREHGIVIVRPTRRTHEVARRLGDVFGYSSLSQAHGCESKKEAIAALAARVFREALEAYPSTRVVTFRVKTQRADKRFPLTSPELDVYVAEALPLDLVPRIRVDLAHAELVLGIHVRKEASYVYVKREPGAGGLPTGTLGRAVALLSGGIDSPVAAWMAMKRGCEVVLLSFHSYPWVGQGFERKVERLARVLARFQARTRLVFLPLAEIQQAVKDLTPPAYRTVLYRRMMQRLANRVAREERALAVVTGESLGQVASQTLENLTCIEEAGELPVLRPLIAFDKPETIALAQKIGTFAISIENEPDCCTVFQPERPIIRGRLEDCLRSERALALEDLLARALAGRRIVDVLPE